MNRLIRAVLIVNEGLDAVFWLCDYSVGLRGTNLWRNRMLTFLRISSLIFLKSHRFYVSYATPKSVTLSTYTLTPQIPLNSLNTLQQSPKMESSQSLSKSAPQQSLHAPAVFRAVRRKASITAPIAARSTTALKSTKRRTGSTTTNSALLLKRKYQCSRLLGGRGAIIT